ncbi:MAG: hypothetical protein ACE148_01635 [Vicinamibacterales bacterium]
MPHPLVLALFEDRRAAASAAVALRQLGVDRADISVVARSHDEEGALANELGATPGAEIEDSRPAARLGELGAHLLAAVAIALPGIGPIVSAGPLAADLGEAAGHIAGGLASTLVRAGLSQKQADGWQQRVERDAVLLGVHVTTGGTELTGSVRRALEGAGAAETALAEWR